ncbi:MAG: hypothetical protein ACRDTA_28095 [Pseudonocardiaceae bacterium]
MPADGICADAGSDGLGVSAGQVQALPSFEGGCYGVRAQQVFLANLAGVWQPGCTRVRVNTAPVHRS